MELSHSRLRGTGSDFQLISSVTASEASIWNQGKVKWRRCRLLPPHHSAAQLHNEKQRAFHFFQTQLDGLALLRGARCFCGLLCLPMLFTASALCFGLGSYCQMDKWWSETHKSTELMSQAARPKPRTIHCSITFQTLVLLLYCFVLVLFIGCLLL